MQRWKIIGVFTLFVSMLFSIVSGEPLELTSIFPDIEKLPKLDEPMTFSPDTLYDYINGAAEIYLQYNFQELVAQEYENDEGAFVTIEIYRHDTPLNAFGIYSQERYFEGTFLQIGTQGYYENGILSFFKGRYYVKLNSYGLGEKEESMLISLAQALDGQLDGDTILPKELALFPSTGKVLHSEQYVAQDFLGYSFLKTAFTANYKADDQIFQMFLIVGESPEVCEMMLKQYAAEVGSNPEAIAEGPIVFDDAYHGTVEMRWKGRYIWGVRGLEESEIRTTFLDQMETHLLDAE